MENVKESVLPMSLWLEDPEFAQQLQDAYEYVKKTPFSKVFPNKYKALTKDKVTQKTHLLFEENPNMPLKNVVATVLDSLDDDLSAELIIDMTRAIIEKWRRVSTTVYAHKNVEEFV